MELAKELAIQIKKENNLIKEIDKVIGKNAEEELAQSRMRGITFVAKMDEIKKRILGQEDEDRKELILVQV